MEQALRELESAKQEEEDVLRQKVVECQQGYRAAMSRLQEQFTAQVRTVVALCREGASAACFEGGPSKGDDDDATGTVSEPMRDRRRVESQSALCRSGYRCEDPSLFLTPSDRASLVAESRMNPASPHSTTHSPTAASAFSSLLHSKLEALRLEVAAGERNVAGTGRKGKGRRRTSASRAVHGQPVDGHAEQPRSPVLSNGHRDGAKEEAVAVSESTSGVRPKVGEQQTADRQVSPVPLESRGQE